MFCQSCGANVEQASAMCTQCGARQLSATSPAMNEIGDKVKASSLDAIQVLKKLVANPVGGLATAYEDVGSGRALSAGTALCIAFAIAAAIGVNFGASNFLGQLSMFTGSSSGLGGFLKTSLGALVLPSAIVAAVWAIRRIAGASAPLAADVFVAGASLAPLGLALLLAGFLGLGNLEVAILLLFFALTYLILILYAGLTRLGGMKESVAAPAVPATLLVSAWLCKVVFAASF